MLNKCLLLTGALIAVLTAPLAAPAYEYDPEQIGRAHV